MVVGLALSVYTLKGAATRLGNIETRHHAMDASSLGAPNDQRTGLPNLGLDGGYCKRK